jgi:hypothetical protein
MACVRSSRLLAVVVLVGGAGCDSMVKVDIECRELCLATSGPTISASANPLPFPIDGSIPDWADGKLDGSFTGLGNGVGAVGSPVAAILEWDSEMDFNRVLAQLPSAIASLSAEVRLSSVTLSSTTSLEFIDSLEVQMSSGTSSTTRNAAGNSTSGTAIEDGGPGSSCREGGSTLRVAYFQRLEDSSQGQTIALVMVNPGLNMFDCLKDAPAQFKVKLIPRLGYAPATDAPLTLGACIGANTHAKLP